MGSLKHIKLQMDPTQIYNKITVVIKKTSLTQRSYILESKRTFFT